jgi:hypothetical protein
MTKYALVYAGGTIEESPEAQQAAMQAWNDWFATLGSAIVDMGNPFGASGSVSRDGVGDTAALAATGYSLVQATSLQDAIGLAKSCPVIDDGGTVDVYEAIEM